MAGDGSLQPLPVATPLQAYQPPEPRRRSPLRGLAALTVHHVILHAPRLTSILDMAIQPYYTRAKSQARAQLVCAIPPSPFPSSRGNALEGESEEGATNDVGILYPPTGSPIIVAAYVADSKQARAEKEAALADVARIVMDQFGAPNGKPSRGIAKTAEECHETN